MIINKLVEAQVMIIIIIWYTHTSIFCINFYSRISFTFTSIDCNMPHTLGNSPIRHHYWAFFILTEPINVASNSRLFFFCLTQICHWVASSILYVEEITYRKNKLHEYWLARYRFFAPLLNVEGEKNLLKIWIWIPTIRTCMFNLLL